MLTPALGCFEKDMNKIINYAKLIKELPINEQSARIKKLVWERIVYKEKGNYSPQKIYKKSTLPTV